MRLLLRFVGLLFAAGTIIFIVAVAAAAGLLWHYSQSLPDYSQLQDYEPAVMTRVHAADGALLAEYARERRLYIPVQAVPKLVINAFVAAEDKNFYEHGGIDFSGIARPAMLYVQNYGSARRPQGASTITPHVAKNFLLTNGAHIFAAEYFPGVVRRYVYDHYSEKKLYEGGLSVRASRDPEMQVPARKVLVDGFVNFDEQKGYRGAASKLDMVGD